MVDADAEEDVATQDETHEAVKPVHVQSVSVKSLQFEPAQVEVEPVQVEPVQVEPVQVEPVQVEPVQVEITESSTSNFWAVEGNYISILLMCVLIISLICPHYEFNMPSL